MSFKLRLRSNLTLTLAASVAAAALALASLQPLFSAPELAAPTPPMGWNSWDAYGTTINEAEVKAQADFMAKRLKKFGWQYVVVDIQWSETAPQAHGYRPNAELAMDANGRLIPAPNRFPSAADGKGFKPLADYVHSLGLKFGIHIMRGIPRLAVKANSPVLGASVKAADIANQSSVCRWNTDMYGVDMAKPGAQAYYDSIVKMYADWGLDFIKSDDMASPLHKDEVSALRAAIKKSGRTIVLSLSPGPARVDDAEYFAANAEMWRVSGDFWDNWRSLRRMFDQLAPWWTGHDFAGSYPDADMLPLGRIGLRAERGDPRMTAFTPEEQRTVMSLWSIARSPLMYGGDLPTSGEEAMALITNEEVLAVDQKGAHPKPLFNHDNQIAWVSDAAPAGDKYLGVFNVGDGAEQQIRVEWKDLGLTGPCRVRDLWAHKDLGQFEGGQSFAIPAHGAGLYRVTAVKK
jgi:alpha-galactosidase